MDDVTTATTATDDPAIAPTSVPATARANAPVNDQAADELVLEELLVEEISIDGMCGVY